MFFRNPSGSALKEGAGERGWGLREPLYQPGLHLQGFLEVLKLSDFALKRKCKLFERSEFLHFRFVFSKK